MNADQLEIMIEIFKNISNIDNKKEDALIEVKKVNPMIGKYCVCRFYSAGVHAGIVADVDGKNIVLHNSRRLWSWKADKGVALSGVSQYGLSSGCKVDTLVDEIYITDCCEIILCSKKAKDSIDEYK